MHTIQINGRIIGVDYPAYFVADIGANHDGSLDRAYKLIELAKESGADAAKFQNFQAGKIVSDTGFKNLGSQLSHQVKWKKSVYEVYEDASVSFDWTEKLKEKCDEIGIEYFTSPYDYDSVDQVDPYVDLYKVGSGDITWLEMIEYIARKAKPILIATGAASMSDVQRAMEVAGRITKNVVLMQCNTNYTGSSENFDFINLNVLNTFKEVYPGVILGLSDHTTGHATVLGAIALGARVIEKHFTDDNERDGPDHMFAMNPVTWRQMVDRSSELFRAMGDGIKRVEVNEEKSKIVQQRSIRVVRDMQIGEEISLQDIEYLRPIPSDGYPPYMANELIGKKIKAPISRGEHLSANHVSI